MQRSKIIERKSLKMPETNNLKQRIELCKLMIARDSMTAVAETSGLILALKIDHTHQLYKPLHDAVVSSYGRAFTEIQPLGRLPKRWSKFDSDELDKTHRMLMYYRNKNVGHTDFIKGRVVIYSKGAKLEDGSVAENVQYSVLFQSFAPTELIALQKLAGNLAGRLIVEIDILMTALYGERGENLKATTDLVSEEEIEQLRCMKTPRWSK
jgi:hypothetical protein